MMAMLAPPIFRRNCELYFYDALTAINHVDDLVNVAQKIPFNSISCDLSESRSVSFSFFSFFFYEYKSSLLHKSGTEKKREREREHRTTVQMDFSIRSPSQIKSS